jgi:ankyrin repeat protein
MSFLRAIYIVCLFFISSISLAQVDSKFDKRYESYNSKSDFFIPEIDDLFTAITFDDLDKVKYQIDTVGLSPNTFNKYGNPALVFAIREGSNKVINFLLDHKDSELEIENIYSENALMWAAYLGKFDLVKRLIDVKKVNINKIGWSGIHYAVSTGQIEITKYLLKKGAAVDSKSPNETTPMMLAARHGYIQIVKYLLDSGADLSARNQQGMSAIDFAVKANQTEVSEGLISRWRKVYGEPYRLQTN